MPIKPQHLSKAPIVEARIAFSLPVAPVRDALLDQFYERIQDLYPNRTPVKMAQFTWSESGGSSGDSQVIGARFASLDGKNVCVVNTAQFVCSRLAPYENWESLRDEFRRLWTLYSSLSNDKVERIGVRYINKIYLPEGGEMRDTLKTRPEIADHLPNRMNSVFLRVQVEIPEPEGLLIITEAQLPTDMPKRVPFVLDHDLQFPVRTGAEDIWSLLEKARELKNQYFFASLSDDLLEEYI